jgi:hypothetical protein
MAARLQAEWSPSFHERVEVALKKFVDHTIRASLLPRDPFRAGIRILLQRPDQLSAILRGEPGNGSDEFARSLVRDYLRYNAPTRKENDPHLAWAVDVVRWMEAEIKAIASSPSKRGRTSKLHLDNLMSAVTRIASSCEARMTLPGHDVGQHPTGYPLYTFAREMLSCGCSYGLDATKLLSCKKRPNAEALFQTAAVSTPRGLIDSLERAKKIYNPHRA